MKVLRFLVRNWPLKLMAVGLSIILFAGMVILQTTQTWPGAVQIQAVHQPANSFLVSPEDLGSVSGIRYVAPPDVRLTASSFTATLDLAGVGVAEGDSSLVKVRLQVDDSRVQVVDFRPQQIRVTLDPIETRQVPVRPTYGEPPAGLHPGTPTVSSSVVDATGPSSYVRRVAYADAHVTIDASGLDVTESPDLVARDSSGAAVENIELTPRSVNVQIQVGSQLRSETVPVNPITTGTPTAGYRISSIEMTPSTVSVRGEADALASLNSLVNTKPISITGATADVTANVSLDLPSGVEAPGITTIKVIVHLQSPSSSRSVTVGIVPDGARSDRVYRLSTPTVIVTIGGADAALNALDTSTLFGTISVGSLGVGTHTVKVTVTLPPGIKLLAVSPGTIVVDVEVAPASTPTPAPSPS